MVEPGPGILLISDPFLKDPNFARTVVFLCEHHPEGTFGFVLNKNADRELRDLIRDAENIHFPVYEGGPVQKDTLHFLHQRPELIEGGLEVTDGIYWGGNFEQVLELLREKQLGKKDIRFFLGYSGWSDGQLENELKEKSWITKQASRQLVFNMDATKVWKLALEDMGGEYSQMINYPLDPQLN
ncbi:YqgE/AlgH family protein [Sediminibacterium soli]|uniref:YqgE/AlgH family protein n=1 Tax=Sediminibacterium soli TaxID=2698829 RepID=UPI00137AB3A1|nr:YqgE/AlgH family protein [Sediminibacterium soli]NCI48038.1 YqgE/AlgH family protein [Sediminibacterium soli]